MYQLLAPWQSEQKQQSTCYSLKNNCIHQKNRCIHRNTPKQTIFTKTFIKRQKQQNKSKIKHQKVSLKLIEVGTIESIKKRNLQRLATKENRQVCTSNKHLISLLDLIKGKKPKKMFITKTKQQIFLSMNKVQTIQKSIIKVDKTQTSFQDQQFKCFSRLNKNLNESFRSRAFFSKDSLIIKKTKSTMKRLKQVSNPIHNRSVSFNRSLISSQTVCPTSRQLNCLQKLRCDKKNNSFKKIKIDSTMLKDHQFSMILPSKSTQNRFQQSK